MERTSRSEGILAPLGRLFTPAQTSPESVLADHSLSQLGSTSMRSALSTPSETFLRNLGICHKLGMKGEKVPVTVAGRLVSRCFSYIPPEFRPVESSAELRELISGTKLSSFLDLRDTASRFGASPEALHRKAHGHICRQAERLFMGDGIDFNDRDRCLSGFGNYMQAVVYHSIMSPGEAKSLQAGLRQYEKELLGG